MSKDITQMDMSGYAVFFNGVTLGWSKEVDPGGLKIQTVDKKIGELNNAVVGKVVIGLEGSIKTVLHQVSRDILLQVMPWTAGVVGDGSRLIAPALGDDLYDFADVLRIHPRQAGSSTAQDMNFIKAVPLIKLPKSGSGDFREVEVEWTVFPDQAALIADPSIMVYGYLGAVPDPD